MKIGVMLGMVVAILTIAAYLMTGLSSFDCRYAKAEDLKKVEKRLDYKIEKDYLLGMREQHNQLIKIYPVQQARPEVIDRQIRSLEADIPLQQDKVKALEQSK